jgi:hypothetical protein
MRAIAMLQINDKIAHSVAYGSLAAFAALYERRVVLGWIAAGLLGTAWLTEVVQRCCSSGRSFEIADITAGMAGIAAGLAAGARIRELVMRRTK